MKRRSALVCYLFLTLGLFTVQSALPPARTGTLNLKNGDQFRGAFIGYDSMKGFGWIHDSISGAMWIEPSAVSRLQLNAGKDDAV